MPHPRPSPLPAAAFAALTAGYPLYPGRADGRHCMPCWHDEPVGEPEGCESP